jgi:hypothetical protein
MDPEQVKKLDQALSLAKENNAILKKLRRSLFWGRLLRFLYLVIILAISLGAYYFIQPYLESLLGTYSNLLEAGDSLPNLLKSF